MNEFERKRLSAAIVALRLYSAATKGPWHVEAPADAKNPLTVNAAEPWRRRPSGNKDAWAEFADVVSVSGGRSEQAQANADFIAFAMTAVPAMALQTIRDITGCPTLTVDEVLLTEDQLTAEAQNLSAKEQRKHVDEERARFWRRHPQTFVLTAFLDALADAFDKLFQSLGGPKAGMPVSDRNADPVTRLVGDGDEHRRMRAEVLSAIAQIVTPGFDVKRLTARGALYKPSARVLSQVRPKYGDFFKAFPREVRERMSAIIRGLVEDLDAIAERDEQPAEQNTPT